MFVRILKEMKKLNEVEVVSFGPYRFIGKSVYARAFGEKYSEKIFDWLRKNSSEICEQLDGLKEYVTDEINITALITFEKFDWEKELVGYTIGKFMKANTPVPKGMDYFDIEATSAGKGWITCKITDDIYQMTDKAAELTKIAVNETTEYAETSGGKWYAEIFPLGYPNNMVTDDNGNIICGSYTSCEKK
jgi:hypothetical protein